MSNILLLNPPSKQKYLRDQYCTSIAKAEYYWHPIDLFIQSGILAQRHNIKVIDAVAENLKESKCTKYILSFNPDVIVFITGFLSKEKDLQYLEHISQLIDCKIIASGGYLLYDCENIMKQNAFIDATLLDYTSNILLYYLEGENKLYDICVRRDGEIIKYPRIKIKKMNYPPPLYDAFPIHRYRMPYFKHNRFASVSTSYGCPYKCNFCIARNIVYKFRDFESIKNELKLLKKMKIQDIFFRDFTFGVNREQTIRLCEYLKKLDFRWFASSRVDVLDEELLLIMKSSGCHTLNFGVETSYDKNLVEIEKNISIKQVEKTFSTCKKIGIKTLAHYIIGLPQDSHESILALIKWAKNLDSDYVSFNIAIPLPDSAIEKNAESSMSDKELKKLRKRAYWSFYFNLRYIRKTLRSINNLSDFYQIIKNFMMFIKHF